VDSVLAIDPGVTTGFAFRARDGEIFSWQHELNSEDLPYTYFMAQLETLVVDRVVCERFDFRQNKTGVDYTPVELIGLIKFWAEDAIDEEIIWQGQDIKSNKSFWTEEKLKLYGVYKPNLGHAMDATKHLMHYLNSIGEVDLAVLKPLADKHS
jgi:hypothetical protein